MSDKKTQKQPNKVWSKTKTVLHKILMIFCSIVFVISVSYVIISLIGYKEGGDLYGDIANDFYATEDRQTDAIEETAPPTTDESESEETESNVEAGESESETVDETTGVNSEFEQVKASLDGLKEKYPDLYGWIKVDNTAIDYPIVQYTDNDHYLNRAPNGKYLPAGSIFVDYRCSKKLLENYNTVIYGHRMSNGSMFGGLLNFNDEQFFKENKYITLSTPDGIYTYLIFAFYQTDMYYRYIQTDFKTPDHFISFAKEMQEISLYYREGVEFDENSKILTLSTCKGGFNNKLRYTVQALLVDIAN